MGTLGIVTGLQFEADIARRGTATNPNLIVCCAGPGPDAARTAALQAIQAGATCLVSFGIAGALDPTLNPGDLIVSTAVTNTNTTIPIEIGWATALITEIRKTQLPIENTIFSRDSIVVTTAEKAGIAKVHQAVAVDMESHAIAALAQEKGVPFVALRVIADHSGQALPKSAMAGSRPDGTIAVLPVIGAVLTHPWEIADLIRIGRQTARARKTLGDLAGLLRFLV